LSLSRIVIPENFLFFAQAKEEEIYPESDLFSFWLQTKSDSA